MKEKLEKTPRGHVLADGEVTGHQHRVESDTIELFQDGDEKFISATDEFTIIHEEHAPLTVEEKGDYSVGIVQEYDPFLEEARNVAD